MFNVQRERLMPGLHNFRPAERVPPGFRMNADGSVREGEGSQRGDHQHWLLP
jgi:hypothetical protein